MPSSASAASRLRLRAALSSLQLAPFGAAGSVAGVTGGGLSGVVSARAAIEVDAIDGAAHEAQEEASAAHGILRDGLARTGSDLRNRRIAARA